MSQKKVLDYKSEKKNRKETLKKKKQQALITKAVAGVAIVAIVCVVGFVVIDNASKRGEGTNENIVDVSAINEYVSNLNMDEAMANFDEEETSSENVDEVNEVEATQ